MEIAKRQEFLTTDKQLYRPVLWKAHRPLLLEKNAGTWQLKSLDGKKQSWQLPCQHQPVSAWSLLREDICLREEHFLYVNQPDGKIWHWHIDSPDSSLDRQSMQLVTSIVTKGYAGCPQYHEQAGYFWIEEPSQEQKDGRSRVCYQAHKDAERLVLMEEHHYYRNLRCSDDGKLAVIAWDRKKLPWEAQELWLIKKDDAGAFQKENIASYSKEPLTGINQLICLPGNRLLIVARSGDAEALYLFDENERQWTRLESPIPYIFSRNPWASFEPYLAYCAFRNSVFAIGRSQGVCQLLEFSLEDLSFQIRSEYSEWTFLKNLSISGDGRNVFIEGANWQQTLCLLQQDLSGPERKLVPQLEKNNINYREEFTLSAPLSFQWSAYPQEHCYGWFYPQNTNPDQSKSPLLVLIHSGPYQEVYCGWPLKAHYFNRLGYSVAYLNYSGSSGYGWQYTERLEKQWGERECQEIVAACRYLIREHACDPSSVILWGGAAGAFSVLKSLNLAPDLFAAGIVVYPYINLSQVYARSDRSYQDYMKRLVKEDLETEDADILKDLTNINCPLAIFHGKEDRKIPWQSSLRLAEQLESQSCRVYSHFYPNLGHLWSDKETLLCYYQDVETFLSELELGYS